MAGYIPPDGWLPKGRSTHIVPDSVRFVVDIARAPTGEAVVTWGSYSGDANLAGKTVKVVIQDSNAWFKKQNDGTLDLMVQLKVTRTTDGTLTIVTPGADPLGP